MFAKTNGQIPSGSLMAFVKIWMRLSVSITGVLLALTFVHPTFLFNRTEYALSLDFGTRWALCYVSFFFMRSQYYTGWLMSQGAVVLSGFGFNDYDAEGNAKWDRVKNIEIWNVEMGDSFRDLVAGWNKGTAYFLKVCTSGASSSLVQGANST
jgi:lysophospholipid acyltransferase